MIEPLDPRIYRPFTIWSAGLIEKTLLINDERGKGPWETVDPPLILKKKIEEEYIEVQDAWKKYKDKTPGSLEHLRYELSDLAATCYMLAARLDPEMSQLRRGWV